MDDADCDDADRADAGCDDADRAATAAGPGSRPVSPRPETSPRPERVLTIIGLEGRIARELLRLARERWGAEAVTTVLRTPGAGPAAIPTPSAPTGSLPVVTAVPAGERGPRATQHPTRHDAMTQDTPRQDTQRQDAPRQPPTRQDTPVGSTGPAAAAPEGEAGAPTVVCVTLSTDLQHDLRVPTAARRSGLTELARAAAGATRTGGHLVVVTSARVYGARPTNPVPLPADAPVLGRDDGGLVGDLLAVEVAVARLRTERPDLRITIVRPAAVVGPGVDTTITRHFESPRLLVLSGSKPLWQFVHVHDVATAVMAVVAHRPGPGSTPLGPVVTVGAPGLVTQEQVEQVSGKRRLELPAAAALATARRLQAAGVLSTSGVDLDYVCYPWVVASEQLEAAGWRAVYDTEACLHVLLEQLHRRGLLGLRRDATVGTASAAVALVGTAALMRRRRRKGA